MNETSKVKKEKKPKAKRTMKFAGPNGELHVVVNMTAPNNIQTHVVHITQSSELNSKGKPKKLRKRGATEVHKDEASAKAALDKIVGQATKLGWVLKTKVKKAKSDAFDLAHLPAAKK
jgi:transcriptional regulator with PAS, ATPase and Fis domain